MSDTAEESPEAEAPSGENVREKERALVELYKRKVGTGSWIVTSKEIQTVIDDLGLDLGTANTANFLKDIVRRLVANELWPAQLKALRVTARQRFGKKRVLEFIDYMEGYDVPFPDRFEPTDATPIFEIQSVSLPSAARRLGREDETWLAQVVVNLRIIESQLAFGSELAERLLDVVPLQIGMKTQPEIDATFIATAKAEPTAVVSNDEHIFVTCEVKGKKERLLEDQLRFQVHQAFCATVSLTEPTIDAVKPLAVRIVETNTSEGSERLIHVAEFQTIRRTDYKDLWPEGAWKGRKRPVDDTPVYSIPLEMASDGFYRVRPGIRGVSYK